MKRPFAIVGFEWLMLASIATTGVQVAQDWEEQLVRLSVDIPYALPLTISVTVVFFAFLLAATFLVSRRRSRLAMWVLIGMVVLNLIGLAPIFTGGGSLDEQVLVALLGTGFQFVAVILLFLPSARAWMRRRGNEPNLTDTFS